MRPISLRPDPAGILQSERRSWHRAIAAKALATAHHGDAGKIAKGAWPSDDRAALIARAAMSPLTTSGYPAFSPVVAFRSLAPSSAALQLFELGMTLDLTGKTTIRIPNVSALPTQPIFVGEGLPAPNLQWSFSSTILGPAHKVLMLSAVTSEMQNATPETASAVIGRVLSDKANRDVDATAFGTAAADATKPAGLLHGVTPLTAAAAGVDAVFADRAALAGAIGGAGIDPSDIVYVCPPGEASFMRDKTGDKVLTTLGLPAKTVAAFAPAGIYSGYQDQPTVETSIEAVIHFEDTTPLDIGTAGGVAAPAKSAFQSDLIIIRVRGNCSWAVAPGAAQVITAVNW